MEGAGREQGRQGRGVDGELGEQREQGGVRQSRWWEQGKRSGNSLEASPLFSIVPPVHD